MVGVGAARRACRSRCFFFVFMAVAANPFQRRRPDGRRSTAAGPNPLLQNHPLMAFHPPMLYLGYVGFTVPFAFAMAALDHRALRRGLARRHPAHHARRLGLPHRRHHPRRVVELRGARVGRLLGLGPGRERVAAAVAHRHRVHPLGDRPGTPRHAAGLEPVARARDVLPHDPRHVPHPLRRRELGARVHAVVDRTVAAHASSASWSSSTCLALIAWRADKLHAPGRIDSPVSREAAFLANNLLFTGLAFVVLLGTVFPLVAEALRGNQLSVGEPYFARMTHADRARRCCSSWRSRRRCRGGPRAARCCAAACSSPRTPASSRCSSRSCSCTRDAGHGARVRPGRVRGRRDLPGDRARGAQPAATRTATGWFKSLDARRCAATRGATAASSCTSAWSASRSRSRRPGSFGTKREVRLATRRLGRRSAATRSRSSARGRRRTGAEDVASRRTCG